MSLAIQSWGQKHKVEVAVSSCLRHPLILGTNWPAFNQLLGCLNADVSWKKEEKESCKATQLDRDVMMGKDTNNNIWTVCSFGRNPVVKAL